jgi:HSP20 family protein
MEEEPKKKVLKDLKKIEEEMDVLFSHLYKIKHSSFLQGSPVWHPPLDCYETDVEVVMVMEIAGMQEKDFTIALNGNILTIHGDRNEKVDPSRVAFHHMEINYGRFERNLHLPEGLDKESIKAVYKEGILEIRIKKKGNAGKPVKEVKVE